MYISGRAKHYIYLSIILFMISALIVYMYFIYQVAILETTPLYSDEYGYHKDLENFLLNHTLSSAFTLDEKYSQFGAYSFHGFSYTLLYGMISTLLHSNSIIFINILMGISTLLLILFLKELSKINKIILITLISTYFIFFLYSFSYMVESVHLLASIIVTYLLYKIFLTHHKKYIISYIIIIFILSLLRQTWIFYLTALFFLDLKNKKILSSYILVFLIGLIWVFVDMHFFHAQYLNGFLPKLLNNSYDLLSLLGNILSHAKDNIIFYFTIYTSSFYFFTKIFIILLLSYLLYNGIKTKNYFFIAIATVGWIYLIALILFYDALAWREHRTLAAIYISMLLTLSLYKKSSILYTLLFFHLIFFPSIIENHQISRNYLYRFYSTDLQKDLEKIKKFQSIKNLLGKHKESEILIAVDNHFMPINFNKNLTALPLRSQYGKVIKYSFYYFQNFNTFKTNASYLLTNKTYPHLKAIEKNSDFILYHIPKKLHP